MDNGHHLGSVIPAELTGARGVMFLILQKNPVRINAKLCYRMLLSGTTPVRERDTCRGKRIAWGAVSRSLKVTIARENYGAVHLIMLRVTFFERGGA